MDVDQDVTSKSRRELEIALQALLKAEQQVKDHGRDVQTPVCPQNPPGTSWQTKGIEVTDPLGEDAAADTTYL